MSDIVTGLVDRKERFMMNLRSISTYVATLLLTSLTFNSSAIAWGPDGHRMVARLAVESLPADAPEFLIAAKEQLMFLSYEPDFWRDPKEEVLSRALRRGHDPDHHFHFERFAPKVLPFDRYSYFEELYRVGKNPQHVGVLPYRAMELFQRMRVSFRQWREARRIHDVRTQAFLEARIIDDAGILAHYIGDASEPLHVTLNHNGWEQKENPQGFTTDNTLHGRFEDIFVAANVRIENVRPYLRPLQQVNDGLPYIYDEIRRSHDQVNALYGLEKSAQFGPNNVNPQAREFVAKRLADGAGVLRDLWYAAYTTSR